MTRAVHALLDALACLVGWAIERRLTEFARLTDDDQETTP
jgi:hypothetical protein